jgi:hypothetical protein
MEVDGRSTRVETLGDKLTPEGYDRIFDPCRRAMGDVGGST